MSNLKVFYSTIKDGNMNTNSKFYPENMTRDEIRAEFKLRRQNLGERLGFDGLKILIPSQKSYPVLTGKTDEEIKAILEKYESKYKDGTYIRINKEMLGEETDYYNLDFNTDILMMDNSIEKAALAYPVADCAVVFAEDVKNNTVAMAHCGGEYIDRNLPGQIIDSLKEELDSKDEDIRVYVGPHAQEKSFTYDCFPRFIKNEDRWEDCLREENGLIHINMSKAILKQLLDKGIDLRNISVSNIDTITNSELYSNNAARFDKRKEGRFYEGCFYQTKSKVK